MAAILIAFLVIGAWALVSASQQWSARRDAYGIAAASARAGAQADSSSLRSGQLLNPDLAAIRVQAVLDSAGVTGSVAVDGESVTVTVTSPVAYAFPAPGFPVSVTGSATAAARRGVDGTEGG